MFLFTLSQGLDLWLWCHHQIKVITHLILWLMIEKPPINLTCSPAPPCASQVVPFPELGSRSYSLVMCLTSECGSHMVAKKKLFAFCGSEHLNNTLTAVSFIRVMRKFKGNYSFLPSILCLLFSPCCHLELLFQLEWATRGFSQAENVLLVILTARKGTVCV